MTEMDAIFSKGVKLYRTSHDGGQTWTLRAVDVATGREVAGVVEATAYGERGDRATFRLTVDSQHDDCELIYEIHEPEHGREIVEIN